LNWKIHTLLFINRIETIKKSFAILCFFNDQLSQVKIPGYYYFGSKYVNMQTIVTSILP